MGGNTFGHTAIQASDERKEQGTGQTIDVSSSGLRCMASGPLPIGVRLLFIVAWPARLDNRSKTGATHAARPIRHIHYTPVEAAVTDDPEQTLRRRAAKVSAVL